MKKVSIVFLSGIILISSWMLLSSNTSDQKVDREFNTKNPDISGDPITDSIQVIGQDYIDNNNVGLMIGIFRQTNSPNAPHVPEFFSFGHLRNHTSSPAPDSNTFFKLGSVEKTFCATILAKIILDTSRHVKLNDIMDEYLPDTLRLPRYIDTSVNPNDTTRISLVDLATHYSSLPDTDSVYNYAEPPNYTFDSLYRFLENYYDSLRHKPGTNYLYSNPGFGILGDICANINDTTYEQSAKDIFNILGMPDTKIDILLDPQDTVNTAHGYGENRNPIINYLRPPSEAMEGAGAHWSTMKDMMRFLAFNLKFFNNPLDNTLDTLHKPRKKLNNIPGEYQGLAWQKVKLYPPDTSIYHYTKDGSSPDGYSSFITFRNETKTGVVVLSNSRNPVDPIANQIMKLLNPRSTGINQVSENIPDGFFLDQNYPNPFNPFTDLGFGISEFGNVSLKIYDLLGKEVATVLNEKLKPGTYRYQFDGSNLSSGVYYYTLRAGDFVETKRMVLLK